MLMMMMIIATIIDAADATPISSIIARCLRVDVARYGVITRYARFR